MFGVNFKFWKQSNEFFERNARRKVVFFQAIWRNEIIYSREQQHYNPHKAIWETTETDFSLDAKTWFSKLTIVISMLKKKNK